jgi:predicted permease
MGVAGGWAPNLTGAGEPERLAGARVSAAYLQTFGVQPALGRLFLGEEDAPGAPNVVVLSDGLWQRAFGGARDVLGSTVQLNGESYEVVGVMPPGFRDFFGRPRELWTTLRLPPEEFVDTRRTNEWLSLVARLGPRVTAGAASAEMAQFATMLKQQYPDNYPDDWGLVVTTLADKATGGIRAALLLLMGAVGFVLLIACANVANLLLARAAGRLKDVAIRRALGADRLRLLRQLLTESLVLAVGGGVLGIVLAFWSLRALVGTSAFDLTGVSIEIDATVLAFTAVIAVLTGVLFGLAPAVQITGANVQDTLREGGRGAHADRQGHRIRKALVVAEIALALMLLTGAGLLIQSFARLQRVSPGFDAEDLLTFSIALPAAKYPSDTSRIAFFDALLPRLEALRGVRGVGMTSVLPFGGSWSTGSFSIEGYQVPEGQNQPWGDIRIISAGYPQAMRIPLLRGRYFTPEDRQGAPSVVLVDEEMVRRYWPDADPIGKRITRGDPESPDARWSTVVGVLGHAAHEGLDADARVQLYYPQAQFGAGFMTFAVRATGTPEALAPAVRQAVYSVDADQPIAQVRTMQELMATAIGQRKLIMVLLGTFAALALLLASLGIYGVMSNLVTQRSRELGVRLALGAQPRDLRGLVLGQGLALIGVGLGVGIAASLALQGAIRSQLFGVVATDPVTLGAVAALLSAVALAATWLPAYRATRVDPLTALRQE